MNERQLNFVAQIYIRIEIVKDSLLTNTSAFAQSFVNTNFVKQHKLFTIKLRRSIKLRLVDDKLVLNVTHMTQVKFRLNIHVNEIWCLITTLDKHVIIVDMFWLKQYDCKLDLEKRALKFKFNYCIVNCLHDHKLIKVYNIDIKFSTKKRFTQKHEDIHDVFAYVFNKMTNKDEYQVVVMWEEHFVALNQSKKNDRYLVKNSFTVDVVSIFVEDYRKFHDKMNRDSSTIDELKLQVLENHHDWINCWDSREVNKLSSSRFSDHRINLELDATSFAKKTYEMSREQVTMIKKYIDDMMSKNFIRRNHFDYAFSMFIVKKSNENFWVCVNYRSLNALIIKNRNVSSLIKDTLTRLCFAKIYIKFDIIVVFNEIRVREDDQDKIVFITRYELFEYVVMSFEFCNALEIFQFFINETLRKYLDNFCIVYLNDILIYSNNFEKHQKHVHKVLDKLRKEHIYLNIKKCQFNVIKVKYLELIIIIEDIKMNFEKVKII